MEDSGGRGTWSCADYSPLNRSWILVRENHIHAAPRKARSRMCCSRCSLCGLRTTLAARFHSSYKTGGGGHTTPPLQPHCSPPLTNAASQSEEEVAQSNAEGLLFLFLHPFGCCRSADIRQTAVSRRTTGLVLFVFYKTTVNRK